MGGTMRCGQRKTIFKEKKIMFKLYGENNSVSERHRHRYEVNPEYVSEISSSGLKFVGEDVEGERMEIIELENHPFFCGLQAHPEFTSRPLKPSPPYLGFILASIGKLEKYLSNGGKICPEIVDNDSDDDVMDNVDFNRLLLDDERDILQVRKEKNENIKIDASGDH
jgi:CTP synthase